MSIVNQTWVSWLALATRLYENSGFLKLNHASAPLQQRLRYMVRFYPQALAFSIVSVSCVLGLLTTCVVQAALGATLPGNSALALRATALNVKRQASSALSHLLSSGNVEKEGAFAFLAQGIEGEKLAANNTSSSVVLPAYGRQDPFKPLVKSTEEPPPVIIDPCEGVSFIGFIQGDKKTPDVAILELALPGSVSPPVTIVKPLGTVVEHNGFSLKLMKGNAHQLSLSVNGSTRSLSLVPVVDNIAAASGSTGSAPDPNANPNLGGQPGGNNLIKELKE